MARCLNPRSGGGHENPDNVVSCQRCDFLVLGAHIGLYEIVSFIGAGSYGYVYKVREPNPLSRILALKVLRLDQFTDKAQASFFQEARRIANLQHPNILPVYNFGQLEESQQPYLVMEYAPQTILDLFRQSDGKRRNAYVEELVPFIQQAANALHYVHNQGLVHQDVKPGNLLIGRNGQLLLSDFGTTYYLGMQTHASLGEVTGTAAYMPPEQWQGLPRRDSDQYALAICCYELLTGRAPFTYKRLEEMWSAHQKELPPSPQKWNARVPVEIVAVLQRAMSKDYRQRYPSILKFADAFSSAVQLAQQRYLCHQCGQQNRTGAQRCSACGAVQDNRSCPYCDTQVRFSQRCCSHCGRLTIPPDLVEHSPLVGTTIRRGRYTLKRVLKQSDETGIMVAVANDEQDDDRKVVVKRWECTDEPMSQRAREVAYYERATEPFARLKHPLLPQVKDRFAEGRHYYLVETYIDGETVGERLEKLLRPLAEREVLGYINTLLNVLIVLEQQKPSLRHYDITPATIVIDAVRGRAILTGFQVPAPPSPAQPNVRSERFRKRTTRKLVISPYLPIQDRPFDQRTCIYSLAASMHHALTNMAPPHYPTYPSVRLLNPAISSKLDAILSRALLEDSSGRYQTYEAMRADIQKLL